MAGWWSRDPTSGKWSKILLHRHFAHRKKGIVVPKTIGINQKSLCIRLIARGDKHKLKNLQNAEHKSARRSFRPPADFVCYDRQIFWVVFISSSQAPVSSKRTFHWRLRGMGPVRIRHSSHDFATQSSHSVDRAGWQVKMASIEIWIPWRNAHRPHWPQT